jgi:hypothetical protein
VAGVVEVLLEHPRPAVVGADQPDPVQQAVRGALDGHGAAHVETGENEVEPARNCR